MDINKLVKSFDNCPCGRKHISSVKAVEIESGLVKTAGEILKQNGFPKKILLVADNASIKAADGIIESVEKSGFDVIKHIYSEMKEATMQAVEQIKTLQKDCGGVLAVGTGSVNDICRYASFLDGKEFAIFATAPSMDGFASSVAPIINNNFKLSLPSHQPSVIIADTKILAKAPAELKAAGFGDVIGKKIARVDWEISRLLTDEYYCENIASLIEKAVDTLVTLAPKIPTEDEEAAKTEMEALVLSGLSISLANSSRPASGAEHMISHLWEIKKAENGQPPEYHGKQVGVATVLINKVYRELARTEDVFPDYEHIDWNEISRQYGKNLSPEMLKLNTPTVTEGLDPTLLKERWRQIREIINKYLPTDEELLTLMKQAGAAVSIDEINVSHELCDMAMKYHPFMRRRITLSRLRPMLNI